MKKLLLLGDSIRMDYCDHVKEMLEGKVEVFYSNDNARFLQYTLRALNDWQGKGNWPEDMDVVHWNNGLWDLTHLNVFANGVDGEATGETICPDVLPEKCLYDKEPLTPPEIYRYMLKRVNTRIRQFFPRAAIVFATTTPVIEEQCPFIYRSNEEICAYNQIARETLPPLGTYINELGDYARIHCHEHHRDWVHYSPEGSRILAAEIVEYLTEKGLI